MEVGKIQIVDPKVSELNAKIVGDNRLYLAEQLQAFLATDPQTTEEIIVKLQQLNMVGPDGQTGVESLEIDAALQKIRETIEELSPLTQSLREIGNRVAKASAEKGQEVLQIINPFEEQFNKLESHKKRNRTWADVLKAAESLDPSAFTPLISLHEVALVGIDDKGCLLFSDGAVPKETLNVSYESTSSRIASLGLSLFTRQEFKGGYCPSLGSVYATWLLPDEVGQIIYGATYSNCNIYEHDTREDISRVGACRVLRVPLKFKD